MPEIGINDMRIGVLGAGVVGVSTAYALASLGHEVTVFEQGQDVAVGASHANGAQLSYSYIDPLAGPATLRALPGYVLGLDLAVRLGLSLKPDFWRWGLQFLRNCSSSKARSNLQIRTRLALDSASMFSKMLADIPGLSQKPIAQGKLVLLETHKQVTQAHALNEMYRDLGLKRRVVGQAEAINLEPALSNIRTPFAGAIYSKDDMALDPISYCQALKMACEGHGAVFRFNHAVSDILMSDGNVKGVMIDRERHMFDKVIVCLGNQAHAMLAPLGVSLPILPMQGYSLTFPANIDAPKLSITSLKHKTVFANLGRSIRIAGFMDVNQKPSSFQNRCQQLAALAQGLWPYIADYEAEPHYWTNYRPMTPSGVPIIGETAVSNLYVNAGHGSLGYTFAAGSAMRIAEMIGLAHNQEIWGNGGLKYAAI